MKIKNCLLKGALAGLTIFSLAGCGEKGNSAPPCNHDIAELKKNLTQWLNEAMVDADKDAKSFPAKIVGIDGFMEYKSVPGVMGSPLYRDYKNSRVCEATLNIEFTLKKDLRRTGQIDARYQIYQKKTGGDIYNTTTISGFDSEELGKSGVQKLIELLNE